LRTLRRGQVYDQLLPKGAPFQLTRDQFKKEQPVFSPDGSRVIYTAVMPGIKSEPGFKWDSWQVPVIGGVPKPFLPNASGLVWVDDQRLLYSEMMSGIHMGIVTSTESRTGSRAIYFPQGENGMAHLSARSPDAKSLLLVEMNGGDWLPCRLMPFDGSSTGRAVGPQDGQCTTTAWSPDGRWMCSPQMPAARLSHLASGVSRRQSPSRSRSVRPSRRAPRSRPTDGTWSRAWAFSRPIIWMKEPERTAAHVTGFHHVADDDAVGDRVFYLMRTGARDTSGELYSMNAATGESEPVLPGRVMANYSISHDAVASCSRRRRA
jgi:hypothetical protein